MTGKAPEPDVALRQDEPRRPGDFGIDVGRLRRIRLICFAVLAIPLLALGLLTLKFVSMPLTQAWHQGAYADEEYGSAVERLAPVWVVNWFEPYLPHLTKGTDLLQAGDNAGAEAELRIALQTWEGGRDLNQPLHAQCKILNNLAISIERQADEIEDPAERGDRLFEAESLLAPCGGGGGGDGEGEGGGGGAGEEGSSSGNEDQETTGENGERIEEKRREADEEAGKDPDARPEPEGQEGDQDQGGGDPPTAGDPRKEDEDGTGPTEEAPTDGETSANPKEDELEDRNRKANEGEGDEQSGGTEQDPDKPW